MSYDILLVGNIKDLSTRIDKLDYHFFMYLQRHSKYKICICKQTDNNIPIILENKNTTIIIFACMPSWINLYPNKKIFWVYNLNCSCEPPCITINTFCLFYKQCMYIITNNFDTVWYKYKTSITKKLNMIVHKNCYYFPHKMFDSNIHKNYNLDKIYDILFYGSIYNKFKDPFRYRLYKLLYDLNEKKEFNILILPYSKKQPSIMTSGVELYKKINQSWLTISTCATSESFVSRYYEIGLCGSVICGDFPKHENIPQIQKNMININNTMTDEEIINIIKNALANKELLQKYSKNLITYFSNNAMIQNGIMHFEDIFAKVVLKK